MNLVYTTLSKPGKRPVNQDCIYPPGNNAAARLFMVCDGVGGAARGEVASRMACEAIAAYFDHHARAGFPDSGGIQQAVNHAAARLQEFARSHPQDKNLSTTLALLHVRQDSAVAAHIGDSRVYHIRQGRILFKTQDHRFVNELVSAGLITSTEAASHPKRNVINRAIAAGNESAIADTQEIRQPEHGDYFLLCSDGILEGIDEDFIAQHFVPPAGGGSNTDDIMNSIEQVCAARSGDNYSAIIVQLVR